MFLWWLKLTLWFTWHHTGDKEIIITIIKNDQARCFLVINMDLICLVIANKCKQKKLVKTVDTELMHGMENKTI